MAATAGEGQSGEPGSAVAIAPAVRVTDANAAPRAAVTVHFSVTGGGGSVTGADAVTDQNGVAAVGRWTLGAAAGTNTLEATVTGGNTVTFTVVSTVPSLVLSVVEGDSQTAAPGSAVSVRPAVRILDDKGLPSVGRTITFTVSSGGGSVTGGTAVSDGSGIARPTSWTLGSTTGMNTLTATSPYAAGAVAFRAAAARTTPDITLSLFSPSSTPADTLTLVGDTARVGVSVTSTYQLSAVKATIAGRSVTLSTSQPGVWSGDVSLVGVPRDTTTLIVTATDVNGTIGEAVRALLHDRAPRVVVSSPSQLAVARPTLSIDATCDDDDPVGCTLSVLLAGNVLVPPSPSPLRTTIDLRALDGSSATLQIEASDSRNQKSGVVQRAVWVESSTKLQLIGSGEGKVLDARDTRLLLENGAFVLIRHLDAGTTDSIAKTGTVNTIAKTRTVGDAYLTPTGAAFITTMRDGLTLDRLYLWRNGSLSTRSDWYSWLAAAGDFIIYNRAVGTGELHRIDVTTGVDDLVASVAGNTDNDVAANGDVVYWSGDNIFRHRGTTDQQLTFDAPPYQNVFPRTDGSNVAFLRQTQRYAPPQAEIWLLAGSSLEKLAADIGDIWPDVDYAVNGGWTAFTKGDPSGYRQVWTRAPDGSLRQVSTFGTASQIRALAPDGRVVFENGNNRFLASPGSAPMRVGYSIGTVLWRDGRFVELLGGSAFEVVP
jgi:hypothetical protein